MFMILINIYVPMVLFHLYVIFYYHMYFLMLSYKNIFFFHLLNQFFLNVSLTMLD